MKEKTSKFGRKALRLSLIIILIGLLWHVIYKFIYIYPESIEANIMRGVIISSGILLEIYLFWQTRTEKYFEKEGCYIRESKSERKTRKVIILLVFGAIIFNVFFSYFFCEPWLYVIAYTCVYHTAKFQFYYVTQNEERVIIWRYDGKITQVLYCPIKIEKIMDGKKMIIIISDNRNMLRLKEKEFRNFGNLYFN